MAKIFILLVGAVIGWVLHVLIPQKLTSQIDGMIIRLWESIKSHNAESPKRTTKSNGSRPATAPRKVAGKPDDLKKIGGIGPKIAELLNQDGITSYEDLANANLGRLRGIMEKAGSRYRMADASSWPKQAKVAQKGDWNALKAMQRRLKTS